MNGRWSAFHTKNGQSIGCKLCIYLRQKEKSKKEMRERKKRAANCVSEESPEEPAGVDKERLGMKRKAVKETSSQKRI